MGVFAWGGIQDELGLTPFRGFRRASEPFFADPLWYFDRGGFAAVAKIGVEQELLWRYARDRREPEPD